MKEQELTIPLFGDQKSVQKTGRNSGSKSGDALRDEAVARVDRNADPAWKARALEAVHTLATSHRTFTTDEVWAALGSDIPLEPRAVGATMARAAKRNWIVKTGDYRKSTRPECHSRPVSVWRSLLIGAT